VKRLGKPGRIFGANKLMKWWKILANMAIPAIHGAGEAKRAEDANDTGTDDAIGISLEYAADLLNALVNNKPLPKAPDVLR
jgi:hypothetical protein